MRKTLTALLIAAALPTLALAATPAPTDAPPPPAQMGDHGPRGDHGGPFKALNLTPDQRKQVGKVMGESMKSRHEITEKYLSKLSPADRKAMQDELKANRDKAQSDIRGLLSAEQQQKFDQIEKEREARWQKWQQEKQTKGE